MTLRQEPYDAHDTLRARVVPVGTFAQFRDLHYPAVGSNDGDQFHRHPAQTGRHGGRRNLAQLCPHHQ